MGIHSSPPRTAADIDGVASKIRSLIADQLRVDAKRVSDEAHFKEDLGADWLDRLELMIAIEDQFTGVEIGDDVADHLLAVGDLIRFVEGRAVPSSMAAMR